MDIKSIHIDFERGILDINDKPVERPTVVYLPSDDPGWNKSKLFGIPNKSFPKTYDRIRVLFEDD